MDPITAGIAITAVTTAATAALGANQQMQQASAEKSAAQYNEQLFKEQGVQAEQAASVNEAASLRKSQQEIGAQAAGFGESNIGTGRTVAGVERQGQVNARMDALNIWYGGELEASNAANQANYAAYQAKVAEQNKTNALIGGGIGVGSSALSGAAQYGAYSKYGVPSIGYGGYGGGYGGSF